MKKVFRFVCLLLSVTLLIAVLSGCTYLEQLRSTQGYWGKDDSTVLYKEEVYHLLPPADKLSPNMDYTTEIYITEQDVPVLLQSSGSLFYISWDGVYLMHDDNFDISYYCRSDKLDETLEYINYGYETEGYFYEYYEYNPDTGYYTDAPCYYDLTQQEADAVDQVVKTVAEGILYDGVSFDYDYFITLETGTEDKLFRDPVYDLYATADSYFLVDAYSFYSKSLYYPVPDELKHYFDQIIAKYKATEDSFWNENEDWEYIYE